MVGRIYKEMGVLKSGDMVEVDRGDLVAGYVGQTEEKSKKVIDSAMDGVLFIDEAYSLAPQQASPNDFGAQVISTLLKAMEDYRDRLVVIVAGYKDEMDYFIDSNPGLKSRFKTYINFEDYNSEELFRIFLHLGSEYGVRPSLDAQTAISALIGSLETGTKGFGNGRTVRNVFDECLARQAARKATRSISRCSRRKIFRRSGKWCSSSGSGQARCQGRTARPRRGCTPRPCRWRAAPAGRPRRPVFSTSGRGRERECRR